MRRSTWLALVVAQLVASPVAAQPEGTPSSPGEVAIEKGREGMALYRKGEFERALALFRESDAAYHSPVFVLYAARSHRNLGRLLEARSLYLTLTREKLADTAPTTWRQAQIEGATELATLEGEIPILVVTALGATPGAVIEVDGVAVAAGTQAPRNPGDHRVVVEDRGRTFTKTVTLGRSRVVSTVAFDLTRPDGEPGAEGEVVDPWQVLGAVLVGVGGSGLVAGGVVGGLALDEASEAGRVLPRTCSPDRSCLDSDEAMVEERFQKAYTLGTVADGLLIGGGIAAAAGILILILDPGGSTLASTVPSSGAGGLSVRF